MENRAHALAAGIFIVLLGIAVALAVWWLSGKREATRDLLLVTTKSVSGLNLQAQVRYRGIRAGKVQDISLNPDNPREILVLVNIPENMPVTTSTTATLNQQGVTGLAYIQLDDDGGGEPLPPGKGEPPRIPLKPSTLDTLGSAAGEIARQLRDLVGRVNVLLSEQNLAHINQTLANLETASGSLSAATKDVPKLVAQMRQALDQIDFKRVQKIIANLDQASGEAAPLAADLRGLVTNLQDVSKRVDALSGNAGAEVMGNTLPRMNQLLLDLSGNSRQLSRLLEELERSPQLLLFGRTGQKPGPGEAGFATERR